MVASVCGFVIQRPIWLLLVLMSSSTTGKMIDLTHPLNNRSMHHPSVRDFTLESTWKGNYPSLGGIWVEANDIHLSEHTGTHIDAPVHTWETGIHVNEIPLEDLIGPAIVINVTQKALQDRNYEISVQDLTDFEREYGRMPDGSIVLLNSDRSKYYWSDRSTYLGTEENKNMSSFNNPGFSVKSIEWLVTNRNIKGIGTDCFNFDSGKSPFLAHVAILSAGRFAIENANNVDKLPPIGATIFVMVIPIENGSGAPARIVAFWDTDLPMCSSCASLVSSLMLLIAPLLTTVMHIFRVIT